MKKRMIPHGLMIAAIIIAAFVAAALTPADTYAKKTENPAISNIARVDFEYKTSDTDSKTIPDYEIPLAAAPSASSANMLIGWLVVAVTAIISGVVIYEDYKDNRTETI